ncbi:MAG: hypothetical protein JETCAE03_31970 [Ignavibacteriaceae bacterium]|jgi:hypothetical protein|nr:MAG: hypothetical protein JETCAE03_31970 [Ignavibacteriaceae bacterium]
MNCPHCNKEIFGWTGLQELQKFQKHLDKCRKNPDRKICITKEGKLVMPLTTMDEALEKRADSGQ